MNQPVSVICEGARPGTASPTVQGSEASMAWARARGIRGERVEEAMNQPVSVICEGARPGTASPTVQGSEASMAWARAMDDNYGGGDDNYPNAVVEMGTEGREEGRGRDRQK